ncbi:protein translocase subunit SecD [Actinomyces sp. B33]|uniref:protein translocase subunit SecD n=1 Tax=Actinomyces sp. B33 TaxID=2942131 RepID=UPI002341C6F3|nr:protein translocase subunit SecD [Actinomyces sp. B33]MDC4233227.1 protein translocase subunit SecD [Actinomyces sp. B33]
MATKKRRPLRSLIVLLVAMIAAAGTLVYGNIAKGVSYIPDLALDLQGGTQLILTPTSTQEGERAITDDDIAEAISIIRNRIDASGVAESEIASLGTSNIVVSIPGTPSQETLDLIRQSSQMNFRPVLKVGAAMMAPPSADSAAVDAPQSGESAQSGQAPQSGQPAEPANGEQSGAVAEDEPQSAVDGPQSTGVEAAAPVTTAMDEATAMSLADSDQDGVLSSEPATAPENASDLAWITEQALYDFYTLDCVAAVRTEGPADLPYAACDTTSGLKYLLGPVTVPGSDLESASAGQVYNSTGQTTGEWGVDLQFNQAGTEAFAESSEILYSFHDADADGSTFFTTPDRNHFAVVLDGSVITAPSMNAIISSGQAQITGSFTASSASSLANQLNFGSLPLNFDVESEQQISATLGSDHLRMGLWAGLIGLLLVVVYLIWQYRGLAIVSAGSLVIASVITYLVISLLSWWMGYRLSLAGVAGLIMAIGVTTDSFIVYFERIRDEVRDGRPLVAAVNEGWDRAKRTIVVSDAVNLVAAAVLYFLAVGGVQGFAFTLGVTTVIDLVVIFLFTHPAMELLIRTRFFGQGHRLSGLDPEHLGAKNSLVYAGRGRVVARGDAASSAPAAAAPAMSLAERRRLERIEAERESAQERSAADGPVTAVDAPADEQEGQKR